MLFERNSDGLLVEVPDTQERRKGRHVSRAIFEADILFTVEEEAARDAEEAEVEAARVKANKEADARAARKAEAISKLAELGLTVDDIKDAL